MLVLEGIKVFKANQVEFVLDYNYMAVHTKSVALTNVYLCKCHISKKTEKSSSAKKKTIGMAPKNSLKHENNVLNEYETKLPGQS